jgi:hypothetical protein
MADVACPFEKIIGSCGLRNRTRKAISRCMMMALLNDMYQQGKIE